MFLLVPAYPGSPRSKAVKWLCVCVLLMMLFVVHFQFLVAYIMTDDCVLLLLVRFSRVYVGKFAITAHFAVAAFVPIQNVSSVIIV